MNIRKQPLTPKAVMAFALAFPCVVQAVSIGEVVLQSRLGEPLLAQVDLMAGSGERIDDSCLSLTAPDPHEEDTSGYLSAANLALKTDGKRQYVVISSRKPLNDAFARLRLQVKCPGSGSVIKTLTILPDMPPPLTQAPIVAPGAPAEAKSTSASPAADTREIPAAANRRGSRNTQPEVEKYLSGKTARPVSKQHPPAQTASKKQGRSASFRLKFSGEPIDESRIGKISAEERILLLAQKKLLDADDQTASFLALQHQVKQLQDELGEIKLQLAQLGTSPSAAPSALAASAASPATGTADTRKNRPQPAIAVKQPALPQDDPQNKLLAALGLVLAILALWLGLRHHRKIKSRISIESQRDAKPILKPAGDVATAQNIAMSAAATPPSPAHSFSAPSFPAPASKIKSGHAPGLVAHPKASTNEAAPPPRKIEAEASEEDSMLEEAGLYAAHGRPAKAVEILQEIIKRSPSKADAWSLLLSIYSSLGNAAEFEKTAREFLKRFKDSPSWSGIQALGRTLDQNNPLYADDNRRFSAPPLLPDTLNSPRPIGDVLMEMGLLSKQDLRNCLDDFDPKKHGRFGAYLVARKAITLAQLDQALLKRQGDSTEAKPGTLPSLQEMENFLADFDPKRDGSVGEFLASRKADTPEQLGHLLQQQTGHGETAAAPQAEEPPPLDREATLDFVLESTSKLPVFDLEFEPSTEKKKPLDFAVEPSTPSSPEISLAPPEINLAPPEINLAFPEINLDLIGDNPPDKKPNTR